MVEYRSFRGGTVRSHHYRRCSKRAGVGLRHHRRFNTRSVRNSVESNVRRAGASTSRQPMIAALPTWLPPSVQKRQHACLRPLPPPLAPAPVTRRRGGETSLPFDDPRMRHSGKKHDARISGRAHRRRNRSPSTCGAPASSAAHGSSLRPHAWHMTLERRWENRTRRGRTRSHRLSCGAARPASRGCPPAWERRRVVIVRAQSRLGAPPLLFLAAPIGVIEHMRIDGLRHDRLLPVSSRFRGSLGGDNSPQPAKGR